MTEQPQYSNRSMPWNLGKFHRIDDTHIKILKYFQQTFTNEWNYFKTKIALNSLGLKERDFYNRISSLEKHGFIEVDHTSTPRGYKLTQKTKELLTQATAVVGSTSQQSLPSIPLRIKRKFEKPAELKPDMDRPHDVWVSLLIKEGNKPADWNDRRLNLIKVTYPDFTPMPLKHGVNVYRFPVAPADYKTVWVRSSPDKFTIEVFPRSSTELFSNPRQVFREVITAVNNVSRELEKIFKLPLVIENKLSIEISKQSHALILNEFANVLLQLKDAIKQESGNDFDIEFRDEDGNVIAKPDRSLGVYLPEMDFPQAKSSEEMAQGMKDFIGEQILKGGWKAEQEMLKQTNETLKQVADNQKIMSDNQQKSSDLMLDYGQKIHTHTESIQKLGEGVDVLKIGIDDMTKKFGEGIDQLSGSVKQLSDSVSEIKSKGTINKIKRLFKWM